MSHKRDLQRLKDLSEIHNFILKTAAPYFTGNRLEARWPRTRRNLQKNPQISRLSSRPGSVDANK